MNKEFADYLKNAELSMEGQRGNYNMIDGLINNEPPPKADLTDGQSYDEIRELAPETLIDEKPSIGERIVQLKQCTQELISPPEKMGSEERER